jgi:lysophospholipase L1-like esterase
MSSHPCRSLVLLLCCTVFFANASLGRSLSIIKNDKNEFLIKAAADPATRYILQASWNLNLWVDVNDEVSGQITNRLDITGTRQRFFRLTPWTPPPPLIRVVLLGDSTVGARIGWGEGMSGYFKSTATVINLGQALFSSRAFLASEQWPQMLVIKPQFVLVQFGWVDAGCPGEPDRCFVPLQEFADNMRTIVKAVRGFNGTPILVTPPDPKHFDDKGKLLRNVALQERITILKGLAAELRTHLIDLNSLGADLLNELGESASDYLSLSAIDRVHFSPEGTRVFSGLVVNALPASLGPYLIGNLNPQP